MERKKEHLVAGVVLNSSPYLISEKNDTTSTIYLFVSLCHYLPLCNTGIKGLKLWSRTELGSNLKYTTPELQQFLNLSDPHFLHFKNEVN